MSKFIDVFIALLIPGLITLYLVLAPYTKVEESFNVQACHDIITFGIPFKNTAEFLKTYYDHVSFPGAVPRTFSGALALAGVVSPIAGFFQGLEKQILVRGALGLFNGFCILAYRNAIQRVYGRTCANWYIILQGSQFHMIFWASRTLPNFLAFGLTTIALRDILLAQHQYGKQTALGQTRSAQRPLILLTIAGVVFRSELAVFLAANVVLLYMTGHLDIRSTIQAGIAGLVSGLVMTIPADTFFWQRLEWPELSGFVFNVLHGESSSWGTSPFHYYLTSSLPKLLFNPAIYLLCIPSTMVLTPYRSEAIQMLLPSIIYVFLYSFVPHKEWRFIVYVVPAITATAAIGANYMWTRRSRVLLYRLLNLAIIGITLFSYLASFAYLAISSYNYPGGEALTTLQRITANRRSKANSPPLRVHMDTLSCMTGVTRFIEDHTAAHGNAALTYDKTEDETTLLMPDFWAQFDYCLVERPEKAIGAWEVVHEVYAFDGVEVTRRRGGDELTTETAAVDVQTAKPAPSGARSRSRLVDATRSVYAILHDCATTYVTRGYWVRVKLSPKIKILRRAET